MKLLETAFAYVQRALHGRGMPELIEPSSRRAHRTPPLSTPPLSTPPLSTPPLSEVDLEPVAVALLPPVEAVVVDGGDEPETCLPAEASPAADDDFADLLSGLGAVPTPPEELSELERKQREIAELQRNLEMLRPIGDELARVEQLRLAERAEFEAQLEQARAEASPPPQPVHSSPPPGLQDVTRLISALDSTLTSALSTTEVQEALEAQEQHEPTDQPEAAEPVQSAEPETAKGAARTREQLAKARERLAEQKQKTAQRRVEAQGLRARVKELEKAQRGLVAERKKLHAPVRELARRTQRRTKPLTRLIELLGLELE